MIRDFNFEFIIKQTMSDKQKFAFDKVNFILLAVGMAIGVYSKPYRIVYQSKGDKNKHYRQSQ